MKKIILLFLFVSYWVYPQCNRETTITICDITTVDVDIDGVPDGILNLYDAYFAQTGEMIEPGTWVDPNFDFVLNPATGDVLLWSLNEASENTNDYKYELYNSTCGDVTPALTINIVLGAFSGYALPPVGANAINYRVCGTSDVCDEATSFNLLGGFQPNPAPHTNGYWVYEGSNPNFIKIEGSRIFVNVPYQAGPPLVDEEVFELTYVVPDLISCVGEQKTNVRVSVVRQASSGDSELTEICEQEIINGLYDTDIELSNDAYLEGEDLEGEWMGGNDTGNQISSASDDIINIKTIYENLIATNPRFGVKTFNFRYEVNHRSLVCSDVGSDIPFIIYESLRPFEQENDLTLCIDQNSPETINLLEEIVFTTENGVTYDYLPGDNAVWEFISGPSTPVFTPEGEVTITGSAMGDYVFKYTVSPEINCGTNCESSIAYESNGCIQTTTNTEYLCAQSESTLVNYTLVESLYSGEDTTGLQLCNEENTIDLISLLNTEGENLVYRGENGIWTDTDDTIASNEFVVPEIVDKQTFSFVYTVTNTSECINKTSLNFTIYAPNKPGIGSTIEICKTDATFNLFDLLIGEKDTDGTWSGPSGYSATYLGEFNPSIQIPGDYTYTILANEACEEVQSVVTVNIPEIYYAGEHTAGIELCNDEPIIDLVSLLNTDNVNSIYTGENGIWTDTDDTIISNDFIVPEIVGEQTFNFIYTTTNTNGCVDTASLSFKVLEAFSAGIGSAIEICEGAIPFNLFDILSGDKNTSGTWSGPNGYSAIHLGEFNPLIHATGDYIYTVPASGTCASVQSVVTVAISEEYYAGEHTTGVEICNIGATVDLISLLNTDGINTVYRGTNGVWTNEIGTVVSNDFTIPSAVGEQTFDFMYTTTNEEGCVDMASLNFKVLESFSAGIGSVIEVCNTDNTFNLFDVLTGDKNTSGTWFGPNGFSTTYLGEFNPLINVSGDYIYAIPASGICTGVQSVITVTVSEVLYAGEHTTGVALCNDGETVDLISLLNTNGSNTVYRGTNGVWTNETGAIISNDFIIPSETVGQLFNFTYTTTNENGCVANATLSFSAVETFSTGIGSTIEVCKVDNIFNLFDVLTGDKDTNGTWFGPSGFSATYLGEFNPLINVSGDYTYAIPASGTCAGIQTVVSVTVSEAYYAGENTRGVELCDSGAEIDLISLLNTDESNTIYRGINGIWTNEAGAVISNNFTIPNIIGEQTFNFIYTTTNENGCVDTANLDFKVLETFSAGIGSTIEVCKSDNVFNLFDVLTGDKNTSGTWFGPNGYNAIYLGEFNPSIQMSGDYTYRIPASGTCAEVESVVTVVVLDINYAGENTAGLELCNNGSVIDLISLLDTDGTNVVYSGLNGIWTNEIGTVVPNDFIIPNTVGIQVFNFTYTTTNENGCTDTASLNFSVLDMFSAGMGSVTEVCKSDDVFNLFDVLTGEKSTSGTWFGPNGYNAIYLGEFNPSIHISGDYTYTIPASGTCAEVTSVVSVTVSEAYYAGENTADVVLCNNGTAVDLISLLETNGSDEVYRGVNGVWTNEIGTVIPNNYIIPNAVGAQTFNFIYTTTNNNGCIDTATLSINVVASFNAGISSAIEVCEVTAAFNLFDVLTGDKHTNGTWSGPNGYSAIYLGEFDPSIHISGDYTYTIPASGTCVEVASVVSVTVSDIYYAGENTADLVLCNDGTTLDLISLLETNGVNTIYKGTTGVWRNSLDGSLIENDFLIPDIDGSQFFNFTYTTINSTGCEDSATLEFEVSSSTSAGIGEAIEVCETSNSFNLFDILIGDKTTGGIWSGPNGYNATHLGEFNPSIHTSGDYIYTISENSACAAQTTTISITVNSLPNAGEDFSITVCKSEREINIFDYIASDIDNGGIITIQGTNTQVSLGVLDISTIVENSMILEYALDANSSCASDVAIITVNIIATDEPTIIGNPSFCMMDGASLEDIDVDSDTTYSWYDSDESDIPLSLQTILKRRTYYLSSVNEEGCESNRIAINVLVNDIGEGNCTSSIPDGVSPNADGLNDVLDISELQESFPDFRISIYNRYGVMVYEGKLGINYFSGISNVSSSRGNELPAGVYYYVFEPNDGISKSFQDSFYLSR